MTLYLQWWWSYPETKIMDELFFNSLDKSKKILYIPTAMVWGYSYEDCYNYISNIIKSLWLTITIESVPNLDKLINVDFSQYGGIYIWWGNTFKLLHEIKKNGIDKKITDFLRAWWSVCWGSAWAIIFWNDIDVSEDADIIGDKNTNWLNLVKWATLWCHYKVSQKNEIVEYISSHSGVVIALKEKAWLLIEKESIKSVWEDVVVVYIKDKIMTFNRWDILKI